MAGFTVSSQTFGELPFLLFSFEAAHLIFDVSRRKYTECYPTTSIWYSWSGILVASLFEGDTLLPGSRFHERWMGPASYGFSVD